MNLSAVCGTCEYSQQDYCFMYSKRPTPENKCYSILWTPGGVKLLWPCICRWWDSGQRDHDKVSGFWWDECTPIRKSKMKFCDLSRLSPALYLFISLSQSSLLCEPLSHSHSSQNKPPQVPLSLNHEDAVTYVIQWRLFLCKRVFRVNVSCMEYWQLTFTDNDRCLYKAVRFKGWSKNWPKERRNWGKSKQWKIDSWLVVLKTGNCNWFSSLLQ